MLRYRGAQIYNLSTRFFLFQGKSVLLHVAKIERYVTYKEWISNGWILQFGYTIFNVVQDWCLVALAMSCAFEAWPEMSALNWLIHYYTSLCAWHIAAMVCRKTVIQ